jgi:hypothetical protein
MALAEVKTLFDTNLLDIPGMLRKLAADIEHGAYGATECCVVTFLGDQLEVFGFGGDSAPPTMHLMLLSAARKIEQPLLDHGRE